MGIAIAKIAAISVREDPYRTPKKPGKDRKNAQKSKAFLTRREKTRKKKPKLRKERVRPRKRIK